MLAHGDSACAVGTAATSRGEADCRGSRSATMSSSAGGKTDAATRKPVARHPRVRDSTTDNDARAPPR